MAVTDPCAGLLAGERVAVTAFAPIALFSGLDDDTLTLLSERLVVRVTSPAELIFQEGDAGRAMYVVLEGSVTMFKRSATGRETHMAVAQAGDWFGELSLLDVMARAVNARADTSTRLLAICPPDLTAVYRANLKMYSLLVMNLARQVSRKLRVAELALSRALCELPEGRDGA